MFVFSEYVYLGFVWFFKVCLNVNWFPHVSDLRYWVKRRSGRRRFMHLQITRQFPVSFTLWPFVVLVLLKVILYIYIYSRLKGLCFYFLGFLTKS